MNGFTAPSIEYALLAPFLIVVGAAVLGVLVEAVAPRRSRYWIQFLIAILGLAAALVSTLTTVAGRLGDQPKGTGGVIAAMGALAIDGPTVFTWGLLLILGILGLLLFAERGLEGGVTSFAGQASALPGTEAERLASAQGLEHTETFPLLMTAVSGMMLFPAANDLLTLFVALEVFSLPLYLLCGLARRRRLLSQEAALKYFLLGAFASAFLVYGIALTYGYAGSMGYAQIAEAVGSRTSGHGLLLAGIGLIAVSMLFKIGAAPFHAWTPDVYQGAPTAVTGFMASLTKVAAFGALLRIFYVAFGGARWDWLPLFYVIAILTMVVGSVLALSQSDIKRLLAYSSIAHAGFLLVGFLGARSLAASGTNDVNAVQAVLFYLVTYGFMTMAAFAIVTLVRDSSGETTALSSWAGLGKESPVVAGLFAFLLLAMAGIPLTSGFMGKLAVFTAAYRGGAGFAVVAAVLVSAVAAVFYIRLIVLMFFTERTGDGPSVATPSWMTTTVIAVGTAMTLILGLVPGPLLEMLGRVAAFIR